MGWSNDFSDLQKNCCKNRGFLNFRCAFYNFSFKVLPFRFQEEFAKLHEAAKLKTAVPTDVNDKLLDPLTPSSEMNEKSYIKEVQLFSVKNQLIDDFIPEAKEVRFFKFIIVFFKSIFMG